MMLESKALRNSERQKRFRERRDARLSELDLQARGIIDALSGACERGRCAKLTNHLPDSPQEGLRELVDRLSSVRLIVCRLEE
jgi:hypothetical protein